VCVCVCVCVCVRASVDMTSIRGCVLCIHAQGDSTMTDTLCLRTDNVFFFYLTWCLVDCSCFFSLLAFIAQTSEHRCVFNWIVGRFFKHKIACNHL